MISTSEGKYYINGAYGKTEAIVDLNNPGIITHNIFGNDLIGPVNRNISTLTRYYYLKDHLGSIRVTVDASNTVVGYDDFDPWGMILEGRSLVSTADARYRFTEKERDPETGHFWFGARAYEPRIGRWLTVDLLAEKYLNLSPYSYVANNPLRLVDPNGKDIWDILAGVGSALSTNFNPLVQRTNPLFYEGNSKDFAVGQTVGDILSIAGGAFEGIGGDC